MILFPKSSVSVDGKNIAFRSWSTTSGANGQLGTCNITTSKLMLKAAGLTVEDLEDRAKVVDVRITVDDGMRGPWVIYGGVFDGSHESLDRDIVVLKSIDYAARMMGEKRVLTTVAYKNQTPSQIVTALASSYGLNPIVVPTPGNVKAGALFQGNAIFSPKPQSVWAMIQFLARSIGYECAVTPGKDLIFGPPPTGEAPIKLGFEPGPDSSLMPIESVEIDRQPRRNKNFVVHVLSFHDQFGYTMASKDSAGAGTFLSSGSILNGLVGKGAGSLTGDIGKPVYTFRFQGISPERAQRYAKAFAEDIAKKSLVVTASTPGNTKIVPRANIHLTDFSLDKRLGNAANRDLLVSTVTNTYTCANDGNDEFTTNFSLLAVPAQAAEDAFGAGLP